MSKARRPSRDAPSDPYLVAECVRTHDKKALKHALQGEDKDKRANHVCLGHTALRWAAIKGDVPSAKLLLDAGASMTATSSTGWTALMCAAFHGHPKVVDLLLQRGAPPDFSTDGITALTCCTEMPGRDGDSMGCEEALRNFVAAEKKRVSGHQEQDIDVIIEQCSVSREKALEAYEKADKDVCNAVVLLVEQGAVPEPAAESKADDEQKEAAAETDHSEHWQEGSGKSVPHGKLENTLREMELAQREEDIQSEVAKLSKTMSPEAVAEIEKSMRAAPLKMGRGGDFVPPAAATMEGYLSKKGFHGPGTYRRYWKLEGATLKYYANQYHQEHEKGRHELRGGGAARRKMTAVTIEKKKPKQLVLIFSDYDKLRLNADSAADAKQWEKALKAFLRSGDGGGGDGDESKEDDDVVHGENDDLDLNHGTGLLVRNPKLAVFQEMLTEGIEVFWDQDNGDRVKAMLELNDAGRVLYFGRLKTTKSGAALSLQSTPHHMDQMGVVELRMDSIFGGVLVLGKEPSSTALPPPRADTDEEEKKGCCGKKKKKKKGAREPPEPWVADDGTFYTRFMITSKDGTTLNLGMKEAASSRGAEQVVDLMEKLSAACLDIDMW